MRSTPKRALGSGKWTSTNPWLPRRSSAAAAGLAVPNGFVITEDAHRACRGTATELALSAEVSAECLAAYQKLGGGLVAVRSSATSEDGVTASFAGQQETILGVEGEAALLA